MPRAGGVRHRGVMQRFDGGRRCRSWRRRDSCRDGPRVERLGSGRGRRYGGRANRGRRPCRFVGQELEIAGFPVFLETLGFPLDVFAVERVHEEREVESGRREVPGEEQGVEGLPHVLDVGIARGRVAREGPPQDLRHRGGYGIVVALGAREPRARDLLRLRAGSGGAARERLEEDGAEREDVAARLAGTATLLRGQVAEVLGGQDLLDPARPVAEPLEPDLSLVRHEDRARSQEPVKIPAGFALAPVRVLERGADLARDEQRMLDLEGEHLLAAALEDGAEALPFSVLVGDVVGLVDLPDPEDLQDMGVLELGRNFCLVHQAAGDVGVARDTGRKAQDGDDLLETRRTKFGGAILLPEPGRVVLLEEHELAELLSWRHGVGSGK